MDASWIRLVDVMVVLIGALALVAWCVLSIPLAVLVGRVFRAGEMVDRGERRAVIASS